MILTLLAQTADALLILLADVAPDISVNTLTSGGIGFVAIGAIWRLVQFYTQRIDEITKTFDGTIGRKDQQILDMATRFENTMKELVARFDQTTRELRAEHRDTVSQLFVVSKDVVTALDHCTQGIDDLKNAMKDLSQRVDGIDRPKLRTTP